MKRNKVNLVTDDGCGLFAKNIELKIVPSVIGSGYEKAVAELAIADKIAYRAARKNMQIHSSAILIVDGEFSGFFTFQKNDTVKEFCLLQSAIKPEMANESLYSRMIDAIISSNVDGYPMYMTVSAKHHLERPDVFHARGFVTYLVKSDFHYMVYKDKSHARLKLLAQIAMTNLWQSTSGEWLRIKKEWNEQIEEAGIKTGVQNPKFATREGCWQGSSGMANVVVGKSFNGNASVLDPVACEIIARMFMPENCDRHLYNPFGGGVQMGFIAGALGYKYTASEIRKNQCDANNKLVSKFDSVKWVNSDSSTFMPDKCDLVFSCPPYYKVETYLDYDGNPPENELNSLSTYEQFRDTLFAGYTKAIEAMNDNTFFVVMTGDSRGKDGGYYGAEAEHELFFKSQGLLIYNRIVYLESEFTRRAHAKITLHHRKWPKSEQKIYAFFKGDPSTIKDRFTKIGRL